MAALVLGAGSGTDMADIGEAMVELDDSDSLDSVLCCVDIDGDDVSAACVQYKMTTYRIKIYF